MCFYLSATNPTFICEETWQDGHFQGFMNYLTVHPYTFFGLNPFKCKFEQWVDEVQFKQEIEKIQGCVTRMFGAMV